tara:strand:- start:211 stop:489 length:279 start_codon:yes stop_codon:yes gene_type:complete
MISYDSLTGTITITQNGVEVSSGTITINASDTAIDLSQYEMKPISIPPIKTNQIYTDILQMFSEYQDQAEVEAEAEQISNLSIKNFIYGRIQ